MQNTSRTQVLKKEGRVWLRNAISPDDLARLDDLTDSGLQAGKRMSDTDMLANCVSLKAAISKVAPAAKPVRVVAFNKSSATNWGVPWHQDRVIAVAEREQVEGFANWTRKSGVWHCEPPVSVLDQMLFVRVHLDANDQKNGAMKIAVGSHEQDLVPAAKAQGIAECYPIESCDAARGDVLVLNMLTLHSSEPSQTGGSRRALRMDFAAFDLPAPLRWVS